MEDLSSVSEALHQSLGSSQKDESTFTDLVEKYLRSNDPAIRQNTLDILVEVIQEGDSERKQFLLEDSSLTYVPLVLPLVSDSADQARAFLLQASRIGRPRELLLALNEALSNIEEKAEGFSVSEGEDHWASDEDVNEEALVHQLDIGIECLAIVLPRLPTRNSTPTLLSLSNALSSVFPSLAQSASIASARSLLVRMCDLVKNAWDWVKATSDKGGEQQAILTQLLFMAVCLVGPPIEARTLEKWFLVTYPRFAGLHPEPNESHTRRGLVALQKAGVDQASAQHLKLTKDNLIDRLTYPSSTSPYSALAALILLTASLRPFQLPSPVSTADTSQWPLLRDCMPVLSAALSGSAVDAGLTWTWHLIHSGCVVEHDSATLLCELLVPLAAVPLSPTSRLAILKLLGAIIEAVPSGDHQILLFGQLLQQTNPFEQVRVHSLSLLREISAKKNSLIISPWLLQHLAPILFAIPSADPPPLSLDLLEILPTMWPAWFTDCLLYFRLLLTIDTSNRTGIKDIILASGDGWLKPQAKKLEELKSEARCKRVGDEAGFILDRWEDALDRAKQAIVLVN